MKIKNEELGVAGINNVNDLLFESLEAKLSLLNNFNQRYE